MKEWIDGCASDKASRGLRRVGLKMAIHAHFFSPGIFDP